MVRELHKRLLMVERREPDTWKVRKSKTASVSRAVTNLRTNGRHQLLPIDDLCCELGMVAHQHNAMHDLHPGARYRAIHTFGRRDMAAWGDC
jgi:hypothetical protein